MTCDKGTYFTFGTDEEGQYDIAAECDGVPFCGWSVPLSTLDYGSGITKAEMDDLDRQHREFVR